MIDLKNLRLDYPAATGSNSPVIVYEAKDDMEFVDGKPTGVTKGARYGIACPAKQFAHFVVKVPNTMPAITQEELDERNASGNYVYCTFTEFSAKLFQDFKTKELRMSCTARTIDIKAAKEGKMT